MDNSADLSTNDQQEITMGNILSSTNENESQTPDTSINLAINNTKPDNGSENLEVRSPPNAISSSIENITCDTTSTTKTDNNELKNIENKSVECSSHEKSTSSVEENMDMWLDGKTSELVKEDNEEDFDVIVKSLETAIVETEHYDTESIKKPSIISVNTATDKILDDSPMSSLIEMMDDESAVSIVEKTNEIVEDALQMEVNQSTNLFETQIKEIIDEAPSLIKSQNITQITTTSAEIDPELSESSIVSASTEDNEETLLLCNTVDSTESDFTLHLEEDQEVAKKENYENDEQVEKTTNVNEKSNDLNDSGDMKNISLTSIVDYDDSSEEEEAQKQVAEEEPASADNNKNLEENNKIVETIKILEDADKSPQISTEKIEKEQIKIEKIADNVKVQESKDKIEIQPEINTKEDASKIIDQPEIIPETKSVAEVTIKEQKINENLATIKTIKIIDEINISEPKKDMESTSGGFSLKLEIDQNLQVEEKNLMSLEDSEEKPRAPSKKIKLIRQKLPAPVKEVPKKETIKEHVIEAEQSGPSEIKTIQDDANLKLDEDKSETKLEESFESDEKLFSDIFKIEDEVENKPVKKKKIKLKRNYVTPPVVLHSSVKVTEFVKEPIKQPVEVVKEVVGPVQESTIEKSKNDCENVKIEAIVSNKESDVEKSIEIAETIESVKIVPVEEPVNEIVETIESPKEPVKISVLAGEPKKIDASIEEPEKYSVPIEESIKVTAIVEDPVKIAAIVEEPVKVAAIVEEPVKVAAIVEEPVKVAAIDEEPVKIAAIAEEAVKNTDSVEELLKDTYFIEESEKISAPIEDSIKIATIAEEPVKTAAIVEEAVKNTDSIEKSEKNIVPIEEPVNMIVPVEEAQVIPSIEDPLEITPFIEKPVEIAAIIEEPVKIAAIIEEPAKITQPLDLEEPTKNIESFEEQIKVAEIIRDSEINDPVEETIKSPFESNELVSKLVNVEEEQPTIEESVLLPSEEVKVTEQTDNLLIEEVLLEPVTKTENTSEEIEENIPETLKPISLEEIIPEIDEVDQITQENNLNIIESSLIDDLVKRDETKSVKQTDQIEKEFEKIAEMSTNINQEEQNEIDQELEADIKETLEASEFLVTRMKTLEPELIEKEDFNLETEKIVDNLPEETSETENVLLTKIESIPVEVVEDNQKEDISTTKTEIRAFETITPIQSEKLPEETNSLKSQEEEIEVEPKKSEEIQFPLLMSRLQDKLHANMSRTGKNLARSFAPQVDVQKTEKSMVIEPETSNLKFRAMKRKHEAEVPSRSVTKPLTVEIDDLESSDAMMQPSEHENIPKLVIKQMPKQEQRSSPKITIKPIKPPGSPEVSSKRSKMSEDSPTTTTRLTIKPLAKPDPLKITITKQKSDDTHSILKIYQPDEDPQNMDEMHVPKLTIKSIPKSEEMQHSPKITIKPVKPPGSPKVTVKPIVPPGDQNIERSHSPKVTVKPVINPEETYPKVTIKPVLKPPEETHKVTQISPRQVKLKSMSFDSASGVTVEPVCSTSSSSSITSEHENPMKISVKPFAKIEDSASSPKLTIKPLTKTCEIVQSDDGAANPTLKLTIKPILKPEESYQSPKITIKPIVKPDEQYQQQQQQHTVIEDTDKPERIILKIQKTNLPSPKERTSTHVRKEPDVKIEAVPPPYVPETNQKLDKIKLKLTKEGSHAQIIPSITTSHAHTETSTSFSLKRTLPAANPGVQDKRQKSEFSELLHSTDISINLVEPHSRQNVKQISEEVTIMKIDKSATSTSSPSTSTIESITQMRLKEMLLKISQKPDITCTPHVKQIQQIQREESSSSDDVRIVEVMEDPLRDPLNEDSSSQDVLIINEVIDTNPFKNVQIINAQTLPEPAQQPPQQFTPKKRGRPRKVPLEVRPEIKGEDCILSEANNSAGESPEGGRPKRTCRAPAGRTPFAVKERKPRGSGRGRGSTRGVRGAKALTAQKLPKEPKSVRGKALKVAKALAKLEAAKLAQEVIIDEITIEDSTNETLANAPESFLNKKPEVSGGVGVDMQMQMVEPHKIEMKYSEMTTTATSISEIADVKSTSMSEIKNTSVSVYEEETRMSASENNSRAQTPARQVFIVPLSAEGPEESQSSVQSSATTESTKNKKGRLEICDPDSAHTTVEQIVEYSWGNGGPYMLQEQIAQFLGVKSFKRKYPGLTRRPVDMQERDYIKEKGLVSESMCDMGLTAVPSSEILDIMYTDFQEKYEEYRKCLRDKQSKEISNKQKAISLATSQEKNKIDFKERAIRSTANWNATFNKSRKETRKCCMDLQTFTVNYPTGKNYPRVPHKNPVGSYPIALVPGQFTDYYKAYSPNELNYLPLNTVRYGPILPNQRCLEASDGSSESDSSSGSDSDSSDESMSTDDEAPSTPCPVSKHLTPLLANTPKTKVH